MQATSGGLDGINRTTWSRPSTLDVFATREGPIDDGEAEILRRIADRVTGQPILDVGVGAGRTIPLLRALSDDYVGIDYLPELVALARERFPGVRIEQLDARDLSSFADGAFGLVVFSTNGIDGVAHDDRRVVLAELHRVLRPGGILTYSTHNLGHPVAGRPPWAAGWFRCDPRIAALRALKLPRRVRAYRRAAALTARGDGWATLVDPAYDFGLLTHFVSLSEAFREAEAAGFEAGSEAFSPEGVELRSDADADTSFWFHLLARRPG